MPSYLALTRGGVTISFTEFLGLTYADRDEMLKLLAEQQEKEAQ